MKTTIEDTRNRLSSQILAKMRDGVSRWFDSGSSIMGCAAPSIHSPKGYFYTGCVFSRYIPIADLVIFALLGGTVATQAAPPAFIHPHAPQQNSMPLPPGKLRGHIIYTQKGGLWAIDPDTRRRHLLLILPDDVASAISFSPDCKSIALTAYTPNVDQDITGADIFVMHWDGTQRQRLTNHAPDRVESLRWSPDGKKIAYVLGTHYIMGGPPTYSQELRVIDADGSHDRTLAGTTNPYGPAAFDPFWSRDSKRILFTLYPGALDYRVRPGDDNETQIVTLDGKDKQAFEGDWGHFAVPTVSRDGQWLAQFEMSQNAPIGSLNLYHLPEKKPMDSLWSDRIGNLTLYPGNFGPNADLIVCEGKRQGLKIDAQGFAIVDQTYEQQTDLWILNRSRNSGEGKGYLRLLVENAHLVDWL